MFEGFAKKSPGLRSTTIERPDLEGTRDFSNINRKRQFAAKLAASNGRPGKMLDALSELDPSGGQDFLTEAEFYSVLSQLGVVGLSVQPMYTWTDAVTDASEPISENVQIIPGMCMVIQFIVKGADLAAAGAVAYSQPTTLTSVKVGQNNVNNGHPIPFVVGAQPGSGRLVYEFTEADGTGQTLTGDANDQFVTGSTGLWIGTLFRNKTAALAWLDCHRVN